MNVNTAKFSTNAQSGDEEGNHVCCAPNTIPEGETVTVTLPPAPPPRRHVNGNAKIGTNGLPKKKLPSSLSVGRHGTTRSLSHRKLSLHVVHTTPLGIESAALNKRRFSNVSDAVTRRLSSWRSAQPTAVSLDDVVTEGVALCGQYIRHRLKRAGFHSRRLAGLQRLRSSLLNTPAGDNAREVFPRLVAVAIELERMHPKAFNNVVKQTGLPVLANDGIAAALLVGIGRELVRSGDLTWSKIVAVICVAAAIGVDCARQGRADFLPRLLEGVRQLMDSELAMWIAANGGWIGLNNHFKLQDPEFSMAERIGLLGLVLVLILIVVFVLQWFGKLAFL